MNSSQVNLSSEQEQVSSENIVKSEQVCLSSEQPSNENTLTIPQPLNYKKRLSSEQPSNENTLASEQPFHYKTCLSSEQPSVENTLASEQPSAESNLTFSQLCRSNALPASALADPLPCASLALSLSHFALLGLLFLMSLRSLWSSLCLCLLPLVLAAGFDLTTAWPSKSSSKSLCPEANFCCLLLLFSWKAEKMKSIGLETLPSSSSSSSYLDKIN